MLCGDMNLLFSGARGVRSFSGSGPQMARWVHGLYGSASKLRRDMVEHEPPRYQPFMLKPTAKCPEFISTKEEKKAAYKKNARKKMTHKGKGKTCKTHTHNSKNFSSVKLETE